MSARKAAFPSTRRTAAIAVAAEITAQTLATLSAEEQRAVVRLLKKLE